MKTPVEKLREVTDLRMAKAEARASKHVMEMTGDAGERPWNEVTVRDKAALAFASFHAARSRARINADAGPKTLGVIVMPTPLASKEAWEAKARELEASGRRVIDTTAGPAITGRDVRELEPVPTKEAKG